MKLNKKKVFYVKEMPDGEEQDISKLKRVSGAEFGALLKESKKPRKVKRKKAA